MTILTVPGLGGSDHDHWQSHLERARPGATRVVQRDWDRPELSEWIGRLAEAARRTPDAVLVAHSLGCPLIVHLIDRCPKMRIAGAMLVAPADVDVFASSQLRSFAPVPTRRLPFPTVVVASTNDPYITLERARFLADAWGARSVNVGACGHINVAAGFGAWPDGETILDTLLAGRLTPDTPERHRGSSIVPFAEILAASSILDFGGVPGEALMRFDAQSRNRR